MAITKDNLVVVYVWGNLDSEDLANYYINAHGMTIISTDPSSNNGTTSDGIYWQVDGQKIGIQTTITSEILTEEQFVANIEQPLREALNTQELQSRNVWGIVLGYKIPGGYTTIVADRELPDGVNLITNSDFENPSYESLTDGTGWQSESLEWRVEGSKAVCKSFGGADPPSIFQNIPTIKGHTYRIRFDLVEAVPFGTIRPAIGAAPTSDGDTTVITTNDAYGLTGNSGNTLVCYITCEEDLAPLYFYGASQGPLIVLDNIEVFDVTSLTGNIISATSRISRINQTYSAKTLNPLFDRQVFSRFDSDDAENVLIVSRIDGPSILFAQSIVDKAINLNKQVFANGTFYIDPYSDRAATGAGAYTDLLVDFRDNMLTTLNLPTWATTFQDPYIDTVIPFVEGDSFVWSWFADRATPSFFQNSNAIRVFAYNADYDGAAEVRNDTGKRWPYLSLDAGYVSTAGAMSDPTIDGFLDPKAFYYSLLRGATIGEAFYFACPHLDWTITLFGDPLAACSFPGVEVVPEDLINEHTVWEIMSKDLAKSAANLYRKEIELREVNQDIVDLTTEEGGVEVEVGSDIETVSGEGDIASVLLLYPANDLLVNNQIWQTHLKPLVNKLFDFPTFRYTAGDQDVQAPLINDYLEDQGFRVSRLLADITKDSQSIFEDNLYPEGWWEFEFVLQDDNPNAFTKYHFLLEIYSDESLTNLIISKDSLGINSWTFEKEKEDFVRMTFSGVSSSYIGRKVRYESRFDSLIGLNEYLVRGQTYYFRVRQYNLETSDIYTDRVFPNIIYS